MGFVTPGMIQVEGLVFDYPGLRALDDVSFAVEPATITALVGPNGAGKSTLLRCIAALATPFAGRVVVDGLDVHEEPRASHRRMGFLADFYGLYDDLSVRRCLEYKAAAQGVAAALRRQLAERAARRMNIDERMEQKAGTLSRGLRQRLAIAQAIVHEPRVLLLDEPASGLDPEARAALAGVLRALRQDGMTIIVSSHILAELQDYSTHMLIVDGGRIVEHRALDAEVPADARQRVVVVLAAPDPRLGEILSRQEGLTEIDSDGTRAGFVMAADADRRQAVLRALMDAGLSVAEFGLERQSLQDAYLARMGRKGEGA